MAAPKEKGAKLIHRVQADGKRTSGTFDTKAAALAWEAGQRVAKNGPAAVVKKTCADAFAKYEIEVSKKKRGYRWEALRLAALAKTSLGAVKLGDLDASHIAAWRDERSRSVAPGTVIREMNLLSHVCSVARNGSWGIRYNDVIARCAVPKSAR